MNSWYPWQVFGIMVLALVDHTVAQTNALTDAEISIMRAYGISVTINNNSTITIAHDGLPDHSFEGGWGNNPNQPSEQNYSFLIPRLATVATEPNCVGQLGVIGLSLTGAAFYNPYTGQGNNAVEGDCQETFDACSGHPSPDGSYHYHKLPACIYNGTGTELRNKLLGVSFDGYPIYGPMDSTGKNWTSLELDECHGHTDSVLGRYIYRATTDFPYLFGCYHGIPLTTSMSTGTRMGSGTGTGTGNGMPPPPPGGRKRRETATFKYEFVRHDAETNRIRYKRQVVSTNACLQIENADWEQKTCYAWCNNPSEKYDDCPYGPYDTSDGAASLSATLTTVWTLVFSAAYFRFV